MAFNGKYEMESEKNYDEFMKCLGLPSNAIEKGHNFKIIIEVQQDGQNFTWSQHYPGGHSTTKKFTIGKECDMETMGGKKFKTQATVQMEGGKLVVDFPNYHQTSEIVANKLVEISTIGGVTYKHVYKRLSNQAGLQGGYKATNKAGPRMGLLLTPEPLSLFSGDVGAGSS